jgi:hypothetical protein
MKAATAARWADQIGYRRSLRADPPTLSPNIHRSSAQAARSYQGRVRSSESRADINSVRALLLYNIGNRELSATEVRARPLSGIQRLL